MSSPPSGNPFSHLWGSFQAAVNDPQVRAQPGGIQSYVWQSIRNDYLSRGESIPAGGFAAVNQLLSVAGQQRRAALNLSTAINDFQRTGLDSTFLAHDYSAPDIDSRGVGGQPLGPEFRIRIEYQAVVEGQAVTLRGTWEPGLYGPQSISGLLEGLDEAAQALAEDYGAEYGGSASVLSVTTV